MLIRDNTKRDITEFQDLGIGAIFRHQKRIYIKTNEMHGDCVNQLDYNAVDLSTGFGSDFYCDVEVEPLPTAQLIIN